jgi:hypothetical protein
MELRGKNLVTVTLGPDRTQEIFFSLGIDNALIEIFSRHVLDCVRVAGQLESFGRAEEIQGIIQELEQLKDSDDQAKKDALLDKMTELSAATVNTEHKAGIVCKALSETVVMNNQVFVEVVSLLLTRRDAYGKVTEVVTPDEILYSRVYNDPAVSEELHTLYQFAMDRYANILKEGGDSKKNYANLVVKGEKTT